jgi:hypothetical protein
MLAACRPEYGSNLQVGLAATTQNDANVLMVRRSRTINTRGIKKLVGLPATTQNDSQVFWCDNVAPKHLKYQNSWPAFRRPLKMIFGGLGDEVSQTPKRSKKRNGRIITL